MSVATIIEEIQNLSSEDQARIIQFASVLDAKRRLTGSELNSLASHMIESSDPVEAMIAREAIMRGFTAKILVPKVYRKSLPPALLRHLLDRIQQRIIFGKPRWPLSRMAGYGAGGACRQLVQAFSRNGRLWRRGAYKN